MYSEHLFRYVISRRVDELINGPFDFIAFRFVLVKAAPLDIYCDNFYVNRKELIQKRLSEIRNASAKVLNIIK